MLFVVDADAVRAALRARLLTCPQDGCEGRLHPWSRARACTMAVGARQRGRVTPDRGRCGRCRVSQALLPAWYLLCRSASVELVGTAIWGPVHVGHSHERVARVLSLNPFTVRGWLHGITGAPCGALDHATSLLASAIPRSRRAGRTHGHRGGRPGAGGLGYAARAVTRPDPPTAAAV